MPLPNPILDDRSYQQLRDELVRRIPVTRRNGPTITRRPGHYPDRAVRVSGREPAVPFQSDSRSHTACISKAAANSAASCRAFARHRHHVQRRRRRRVGSARIGGEAGSLLFETRTEVKVGRFPCWPWRESERRTQPEQGTGGFRLCGAGRGRRRSEDERNPGLLRE